MPSSIPTSAKVKACSRLRLRSAPHPALPAHVERGVDGAEGYEYCVPPPARRAQAEPRLSAMRGRLKVILSRLLEAVPVVIGVVIVTFILTRALPGDRPPIRRGRGRRGVHCRGCASAWARQVLAGTVFCLCGRSLTRRPRAVDYDGSRWRKSCAPAPRHRSSLPLSALILSCLVAIRSDPRGHPTPVPHVRTTLPCFSSHGVVACRHSEPPKLGGAIYVKLCA
jgi:hypothetical protein